MATKIPDNGIRAFSDDSYDYYELIQPLGILPKGAVFVHDEDDDVLGSPMRGCLKLCWTPSGGCWEVVANTVILHFDFVRGKSLFKLHPKKSNADRCCCRKPSSDTECLVNALWKVMSSANYCPICGHKLN